MSDILFRASFIGRLMTEPRSVSEGALSVGAKSAIRELVAQDVLGVDFEINDKKIEKGNLVEGDCLDLVNRVFGLQLVKNKERRNNGWVTGEPDCVDTQATNSLDIKAAWSAQTFPIVVRDIAEAQRKLYDFQFRTYMWLWDQPVWHGCYCLVDTPEHLCRYEAPALHMVSHIPEHLRVTRWTVKRDKAIEAQMIAKVVAARAYYREVLAEFDATHQPLQQAA